MRTLFWLCLIVLSIYGGESSAHGCSWNVSVDDYDQLTRPLREKGIRLNKYITRGRVTQVYENNGPADGGDYFWECRIESPRIGKNDLTMLNGLFPIRVVRVSVPVPPEIIEWIHKNKSVQYLDYEDAGITDDGLATIGHLSDLVSLTLCKAKITDKGLWHIRPNKKIERLELGATQVGDKSLEILAKIALPRLRSL